MVRHLRACYTLFMLPRAQILVLFLASCGSYTPPDTSAETGTTEPVDTSSSSATDSATETIGQEPAHCVVSMPLDESAFPDEIAAVVCALRKNCGCEDADNPQCGQDFATYFTDLRAYATSKGLEYDADCAARRVQEYLAAGCNAGGINTREACAPCYVYSGEALPAEACETVDPLFDFGIVSTCASDDTECYLGKCVPPGAPEGEWCWGTKGCAAGLACDAQGTICASAKEGEPCLGVGPSDKPCADGLWCDSTVCRARKSLGATCQIGEECLTLRCEGGLCTDYAAACDLTNPMYWPFYVPGPP